MPNSQHCLARRGEASAGPCMVPEPQFGSGQTRGLLPGASRLLPAQLFFLPPPRSLVLPLSLEGACGAAHWAQTATAGPGRPCPLLRQGSWMDLPYAALRGRRGKGPFALAGPCPPDSSL